MQRTNAAARSAGIVNAVGAIQQKLPFAFITGERSGALEFGSRFIGTAEFDEKIAPDTRQQMIVFQRRLRNERIGERETGRGSFRHADGDRPVELDHG